MLETIKRLGLGFILIALAAGVLLYTDRGSRNNGRKLLGGVNNTSKVLRVALVQHASLPVFEEGGAGVLGALTARGLSLIHISEPTRQAEISYAVFCLKK